MNTIIFSRVTASHQSAGGMQTACLFFAFLFVGNTEVCCTSWFSSLPRIECLLIFLKL